MRAYTWRTDNRFFKGDAVTATGKFFGLERNTLIGGRDQPNPQIQSCVLFFKTLRHLYNLYPLLVHAPLFGRSYVTSADTRPTQIWHTIKSEGFRRSSKQQQMKFYPQKM